MGVRIIDPDDNSPSAAGDSGPPTQLTLEVLRAPLPAPESLDPIFDSRGLWKVFLRGALYTFDLPHLSAVVDFTAGRGSIFLKDNVPAGLEAFDYPLDEVLFSKLLADNGAIIVHACGVDLGGRGILFCGPSGSGKSTMADLFSAGNGAAVLSDDRVAVGMRRGRAWMAGTPWHGTSGRSLDRTVPLRKIFFLHHAEQNLAVPLAPAGAAARLASLSVIPYWHRDSAQKALDATVAAAERVPAADLGFRPDAAVLDFIQNLL